MKILLTGASGFLGRTIISVLPTSSVLSLSRFNTISYAAPDYLIPKNLDFDVFIHAAGKAHSVPRSISEKKAFFDVNVLGAKNLLRKIETCNSLPKSFVFISSVSVYGLEEGVNINENAPLLARDPYGLSKLQAEEMILNWCQKNAIICTILRLPLLIGSNPPGNLGAMISGIKRGFYFTIDGGCSRKSMVLASDVAKCLLSVSKIGGIYNLTDGYHPSFIELSDIISKQLGRKPPHNMPLSVAKTLANVGDLVGDRFPINSTKLSKILSTLTFDDSKARMVFGWAPSPVLEEFKI